MMLSFREDTHQYFWDGDEVPSVSHMLAQIGLKKKGVYARGAAERGTAVHLYTQLYDQGLIEPAECGDLAGYVDAWAAYRKASGFVPTAIEAQRCNVELWLAGTIDRVGMIGGERWKLDIKSGVKESWHRYQLAAYNLLDGNRDLRACVYLTHFGTYKVQPWTNDADHELVLAKLAEVRRDRTSLS